MNLAAVIALLALVLVPLVMGIWWLFWSLYTWVMPQVWPTGPAALIEPGYWLFVGMWVLLAAIGSMFRSKAKE